jgi:outer membrane protein assembly factor BamB
MRARTLLLLTVSFIVSLALRAEDVYRFRGVNSQGKYQETGLLTSWPAEGLTPKWQYTELGDGWSGVTKDGRHLYVNCLSDSEAGQESVLCLNLQGKKVWQTSTGIQWAKSHSSARATPTFCDGRILVYSGGGELCCLDAKDGRLLWKSELAQKYGTAFGGWGLAESVVAQDGKVFVTVAGKKASAVALKLSDGSVLWEAAPTRDRGAYVTPVLYEKQLIMLTAKIVFAADIDSGKILWQESYADAAETGGKGGINCNTPLLKGRKLLLAAGYDQGGVMFEILPNAKGLKKLWLNKDLDPHHGGMVELNGRIYASNWLNNSSGNWICVDWNTGRTIYETPWAKLGKGSIITADGMLYVYEEKRGTLALVKPGNEFTIVSSFPITYGTREHWSHPVISDGVLYLRRGTTLAAFDLRANRGTGSGKKSSQERRR